MRTQSMLVNATVLGLAQILVWGGSFFLMAVLADPVVRDTGWPRQWVYGSLSLGILISGLLSPRVGQLIARHGGRRLLAGSGWVIAVGLVMLGAATSLPIFMLAWTIIGVGMAAGLYDSLFATLAALHGEAARRAISQVTLISGFCTTLTWPVIGWLIEHVGWRHACWGYAALLAVLVWPMYFMVLPPDGQGTALTEHADAAAQAPPYGMAFTLLTMGFTLSSVIMTAISVQLIALMQAKGLSLTAAIGLGALIGPSQVGARAIDALASRLHPLWSALGSTLLVAVGLLLLLAPAAASLGIVLYGAGSGIRSIVRGTLPLALFGKRHYAVVLGRIARPVLIAQALTPLLGGYLMQQQGATFTLVALCLLALLNMALVLALFPYRRGSTPVSAEGEQPSA
ncbi:MFS transporter [Dyella silvatica]|uniref:MFS transporter n=1 Tax=Dyella silvatica TaxID=2992128 RepID=UPI0022513732|nr:MFS transporter [Dyella silvatica]